MEQFASYIGGKQRLAERTLDSVDPTTGRLWASVPAGTAQDVDESVRAASAAQQQWSSMSVQSRGARLAELARLLEEHGQELARIETRDNGRVLREVLNGDLARAPQQIRYHAGLAELSVGETVPIEPSALTFTAYEPIGVVGIILPYNAPLSMFFNKVSAALAAGNAVVIKPSEHASCSSLAAAALFDQLDVPDGLVNVVSGEGPVVGARLAEHPDVGMLHFTGSTATGIQISRSTAGTLKRLSLELGGKSPNIVFADADLDLAVAGVSSGIFTGGAGQSCLAGSRILIERDIFDDFVARLRDHAASLALGDPSDLSTDMGPLTFDAQFAKVRSYLEPANVIFGGRAGRDLFDASSPLGDGYFVEPTLLSAESPRAIREEIFGPVAVAIPFTDEAEAIKIANDTEYGLAAGLWTQDVNRVRRVSAALDVGTVWVNTYRRIHWALPFPGRKRSGNSAAGGAQGLREWQNVKAVWIETGL